MALFSWELGFLAKKSQWVSILVGTGRISQIRLERYLIPVSSKFRVQKKGLTQSTARLFPQRSCLDNELLIFNGVIDAGHWPRSELGKAVSAGSLTMYSRAWWGPPTLWWLFFNSIGETSATRNLLEFELGVCFSTRQFSGSLKAVIRNRHQT